MVVLAKRFQRMRTEEPGGGSCRRVAVTVQDLAQGTAGVICTCRRPGPAARRSSNHVAAGGSDAYDAGGAAATAFATSSIDASSPARRAVSALQWKGRKPSGVMRSSSTKGAI